MSPCLEKAIVLRYSFADATALCCCCVSDGPELAAVVVTEAGGVVAELAAGVVGPEALFELPGFELLPAAEMMTINKIAPSTQNRFFRYQGLSAFAFAFATLASTLADFGSSLMTITSVM